ncbi:MAG: hypothetical protein ACOQNY_01530 [Mycoplasmoidaceae bacterium]
MKRKILSTLFTLPIISLSIGTSISCTPNTNKIEDENDPVVSSSTTYVTFLAKPGDEAKVKFVGDTRVKATIGTPFASLVTPFATKDQYVVSAWTDVGGNEYKPTDLITKDMKIYAKFDDDVDLKNCVGLTALDDSIVTIVKHGTFTKERNIKYSVNGGAWTDYDWTKSERGQLVIDLKAGDVVYFKGNNKAGLSESETNYISFSIGGTVSLNGNVMTLLDDGEATTDAIPCNYCFYKLFEECSGIVSISSNFLPAKHLKDYSYAYMFEGCQRLTDFPRTLLDDRSLYENETYQATLCYCGMFMNCTGLKEIPTGLLPAGRYEGQEDGSLSTFCYYGMFEGCTGLTELNAGILPSTSLGHQVGSGSTATWKDYYGCYCNMFSGCVGITRINETQANPLLPATTLARNCYVGMFHGCLGLTDLSSLQLPATDFTYPYPTGGTASVQEASNCYDQMFYGCTNLTKAPALKATILSTSCYSSMFYNCEKLTGLPTLPDQNYTLADNCFQYMFYNCKSITSIPALVATTMKDYCYSSMFVNCTNLETLSSSSYSLPATTLAPYCYESMFEGCTKLKQAPTLSGANVTLKQGCYSSMFSKCTSLVTAPALPATTSSGAPSCYYAMFQGCTSLTTATISLDYTKTSSYADNCCAWMFEGCLSLDVENEDEGRTTGTTCIRVPTRQSMDWYETKFGYMFQRTKNYPYLAVWPMWYQVGGYITTTYDLTHWHLAS